MDKKYHYVYKTINKLNGMEYIGVHSTDNLDDNYLGSGTYLRYAFKKYGPTNFQKEIIQHFETREEAEKKEKELVSFDYITDKKVYNLVLGGGLPKGRDFSLRKFRKDEEEQLLLGFSKTEEIRIFNKDLHKLHPKRPMMLFCINTEKEEEYKREIEARKRLSNANILFYDISHRLELEYFEAFLNEIPSMCKAMTSLWNDQRYHKKALGFLSMAINRGWMNFSGSGLIIGKQLEAA
jgi:hypothetical protein